MSSNMLLLHVFAVFCVALVACIPTAPVRESDCLNGKFQPTEKLINYQAGNSPTIKSATSKLYAAFTKKLNAYDFCDQEKNDIKKCFDKRVGDCVTMRPAELEQLKKLTGEVNADLNKLPKNCNKTQFYGKRFVYNYCVSASCEVKVTLPPMTPPHRGKRGAGGKDGKDGKVADVDVVLGDIEHEHGRRRQAGRLLKLDADVLKVGRKREHRRERDQDDEHDEHDHKSSESCGSSEEKEHGGKRKNTGNRGLGHNDNVRKLRGIGHGHGSREDDEGHHNDNGHHNDKDDHDHLDHVIRNTGSIPTPRPKAVSGFEGNLELDIHVSFCQLLDAQFVAVYEQFPSSYHCPAAPANAKEFCAKYDKDVEDWLACVSTYEKRVLTCLKDLEGEINKCQSADDFEAKMCAKK